jgi:hypothetical protein
MSRKSRSWLKLCLKALAEEPRLTIIGLLAQHEYTFEDLAQRLNLSIDAATQHLTVLREVGLVNLRLRSTQRTCRLNPTVLQDFKEAVSEIDVLPATPEPEDYAWLEALNLTDFERRVLRAYVVNGKIRVLPERHKTLTVIMSWVAKKFQAGIDYAEHEVNTLLTEYFEDYVTLRRELINYGYLKRQRDGSRYWIGKQDG